MDSAKALATPPGHVVFDMTNHPTRLHLIEALRGTSGYLTLTRLVIDSYEREEHLLFSGFDEDGQSLDHETIEKLFSWEKRDGLIDALERRLAQGTETEALFTIRWAVR